MRHTRCLMLFFKPPFSNTLFSNTLFSNTLFFKHAFFKHVFSSNMRLSRDPPSKHLHFHYFLYLYYAKFSKFFYSARRFAALPQKLQFCSIIPRNNNPGIDLFRISFDFPLRHLRRRTRDHGMAVLHVGPERARPPSLVTPRHCYGALGGSVNPLTVPLTSGLCFGPNSPKIRVHSLTTHF